MTPINFTPPSSIPDSSQLPPAGSVDIAPLLPSRKTALPYTANEYRLLPDDQKTATLSFLLEGKTAAEFFGSLQLDTTEAEYDIESANREIIEWCVTNDEPETLEFFFERNPEVNFIIDAAWPEDKLISVAARVLDIHPALGVSLVSHSFEPSTYPFLCKLISDSRVVALDMDMSEASEADLLQFMKVMRSNLSVSIATIDGMKLTEETEQAFAFVLANHLTLSTLNLHNSDFGPAGGANIFSALAGNKVLKELMLEQVVFATNYQHGLGDMLEKNNCVTTLCVRCQNFGPDGVKNILKGAQKNTSLEVIVLDSEVKHAGTTLELMKFIALNKPVRAMRVTCNPLSDDEKLDLVGVMYKNKFLCDLEWFTEDYREAYDHDVITQFVFKVLKENRQIHESAILNQTSRSFSDKPFDSRAFLPEEPAQLVIDNLWQLSESRDAFDATTAELSLTLNEVARQEEARKKAAAQAKSQGASNTLTHTGSSSSSSSTDRKNS